MELLKLVIVDDEPIILRGLVETYDWNSMGFEVVGSATNGEKALNIISKLNPHVVLTDIRMKNMTGLMLMDKVKEFNSEIIFIIISAYRDFEYAQKACECGAFCYLVKPVEEKQLETTMKSVYDTCIQKLQMKVQHENWKKVLLENTSSFQKVIIERYLKGIVSVEEIQNVFNMLSISIDETESFVAVNVDIDISYKITEQVDAEAKRFALFNHLNNIFMSKYKPIEFKMNNGSIMFIINTTKNSGIDNIKKIIEETREFFNIEIISAISSELNGIHGLKKVYEQALKMYELANEAGASIFTMTQDITSENNNNTYSDYIEQLVLNTIRKNDKEQFKQAYTKFVFSLPTSQNEDYIQKCLYRLTLNIYFMLNDTYGLTDEIKNSINNFYKSLQEINSIKSIDILFKILIKVIETRLQYSKNQTSKYFNSYITEALDYIEQHIDDDTLSITTVSEKIFLNSVYFGRLFKNTLNIPFKQYVLNRRIERAKKLIIEENDSITSICNKVGIPNPSYFTQLFKQSTGYLPSEYKKECV